MVPGRQKGGEPYRKGYGCAAGDGKKRADGQIKSAGEEKAVSFSNPAAKLGQSAAAADAKGRHAQQGKTHAGDAKAGGGDEYVPPGQLAHGSGENQVSGAEKQAEQHAADGGQFAK